MRTKRRPPREASRSIVISKITYLLTSTVFLFFPFLFLLLVFLFRELSWTQTSNGIHPSAHAWRWVVWMVGRKGGGGESSRMIRKPTNGCGMWDTRGRGCCATAGFSGQVIQLLKRKALGLCPSPPSQLTRLPLGPASPHLCPTHSPGKTWEPTTSRCESQMEPEPPVALAASCGRR